MQKRLKELGVGYLHLMPLLTPRPAPNDGGYAVMDYRADQLGIHVATVSRAVSDEGCRTSRGRNPHQFTSAAATSSASTGAPSRRRP